jgi:hypothetical protein
LWGGDTLARSDSERNGDGSTNGHGGASAATIAATGLVGMLLQTLLAERTSFASGESAELASLKELTSRLTRETVERMPSTSGAGILPAKSVAATKEIAAAN